MKKHPIHFNPLITAVALSLGLLPASNLFAASATWNVSPTSGNWVATGGENNWSTGANTFPGSTSVLNNADTATFLTSGTTAITINSTTLNVGSITFGNVASASAFTIGSTAGNSLLLSSGGAISITSSRTVAGATETVNAPLVLQPASGTTAGTYSFSNASGLAGDILVIGGAISGGTTTQGVALTLTGASTTANTISGAISDGGATGGVSVSKTSSGTWALTGINTYTGATNISGGTITGGVLSGTLTLSGANGALSNTSAVNMSGGRLLLDNTTASGGPNGNRVNDAAAINVTAGANVLNFSHSGVAATNYSEALGTLNLSGGDFTNSSSAAATSQTSTLTYSGFNRTGIATVAFADGGQLGNVNNRNRVILTGQSDSTFLGGWATFGAGGQFAAYDATTARGVIGATITSLVGVAAGSSSSTANYRSSGAATLTTSAGTYSGNTLAFASAATQSLDLNGSTFKLSGGGITTATDIYTTAITNGTITAADTASPTTLYIHSRSSNGSALSISASIADPTGGGSLSLVKAGNSGLTLTGANTHSGTTSINSGSLTVSNALALQNSVLDYNNQGGTVAFTNTAVNYSLGGLSGAQALTINGGTITGVTLGNSNGGTGTNATYSGNLILGAAYTLSKTGSNTQTLSGANTIAGSVAVNGGELRVNNTTGSGTGAASITVNNTGTLLSGTGTITPGASNTITVNSGAKIAPGSGGIGTLTLNSATATGTLLTLATGAGLNFELGSGLTSDKINFNFYAGASDFARNSNVIDIVFLSGVTTGTYNLFNFYSNAGTTLVDSGFSSGLSVNFLTAGATGILDYSTTGQINLVVTAVPEPSTYIGGGLILGLAAWSQRKRFTRLALQTA